MYYRYLRNIMAFHQIKGLAHRILFVNRIKRLVLLAGDDVFDPQLGIQKAPFAHPIIVVDFTHIATTMVVDHYYNDVISGQLILHL